MDELALHIRDGNEDCFDQFFYQNHHKVVRFLHHLLGNPADARDLAQDVFLKVWQNRAQIDPLQSLDAWLFTIVRNEATSYIRKLLAEKKRLQTVSSLQPAAVVNNEGAGKLQYEDTRELFLEAAAGIHPNAVRCLLLHREQGLSYRQIADLEGVSVKAVEKRISTALHHLRHTYPFNESLATILLLPACVVLWNDLPVMIC